MAIVRKRECARAVRVWVGEEWESWLLPFERIPIPLAVREDARQVVDRLVLYFENVARLAPEYFLQFNQLHNENGSAQLSAFGKEWMPSLGLGVWPDREPPSLWTQEEFLNLSPGEMIRPLNHQVFRIGKPGPARHDAMARTFGIGAGLLMLTGENDRTLLARTTDYLLPRIEEPSFRAYEFYVPLLERKSISSVDDTMLHDWLAGSNVYIRESPEDSGILLISSIPVAPIWTVLGMQQDQSEAEWALLN